MIFDTYIEIEEVELDIKVTYSFTPELPAKINCLPDDAYPAEAAEIKIETVMVFGKDIYPALNAEEKDKIKDQALEHAISAAIDLAEKNDANEADRAGDEQRELQHWDENQ